MADRFEQALRAGSARFAMTTNMEQPRGVRARGDRRRRRRVAVVASVVVLAVAGLGGTAYAAGWTPGHTPAPAASASPSVPPSHRGSPTPSPSRTPDGGMSSRPGGDETDGAPALGPCDLTDLYDAKKVDGGVGGGHALTVVGVEYRGSAPCRLPDYPTLTGAYGGNEQTGVKRRTIPVGHGTWFDGGDTKRYGATAYPGHRMYFDLATTSADTGQEAQSYVNLAIVAADGTEIPIVLGGPVESTGGFSVSRWYATTG
ncbi:MAG TPA: hypothetical protein VGN37_28220 [Actinocatenispora sp.]